MILVLFFINLLLGALKLSMHWSNSTAKTEGCALTAFTCGNSHDFARSGCSYMIFFFFQLQRSPRHADIHMMNTFVPLLMPPCWVHFFLVPKTSLQNTEDSTWWGQKKHFDLFSMPQVQKCSLELWWKQVPPCQNIQRHTARAHGVTVHFGQDTWRGIYFHRFEVELETPCDLTFCRWRHRSAGCCHLHLWACSVHPLGVCHRIWQGNYFTIGIYRRWQIHIRDFIVLALQAFHVCPAADIRWQRHRLKVRIHGLPA